MSLDFSFGGIIETDEGMQWIWPGFDKETNPRVPLNPKVETMIWATMSTGIRSITVDNYGEFYRRYLMINSVGGYDSTLTLEDVFRTIGLSTNASTKTYPAFKKDVISMLEREINWKVSQEVKELDK
jgi:hypothetical protein